MWLTIMDWGDFLVHGVMNLCGLCDDGAKVGNMDILEMLELATLCDDV